MEIGNCFRHNKHIYILYLRCEDAVLAILCTGIPNVTITAGEWLYSLIFHDDNKCITANGQMIINFGSDNMSGGDYSFHTKLISCIIIIIIHNMASDSDT